MRQLSSRSLTLVLVCLAFVVFSSSSQADEYIVLDGVGGVVGRFMQPEVRRLTSQGHHVIYRPWWAWRSAARAANGPVNIVGFSMGGSRASLAAQRLDVRQLELLDPYLLRKRPVYLPAGVPTTIYRPTQRSWIRPGPVIGSQNEIYLPSNHIRLPGSFRSSYSGW